MITLQSLLTLIDPSNTEVHVYIDKSFISFTGTARSLLAITSQTMLETAVCYFSINDDILTITLVGEEEKYDE